MKYLDAKKRLLFISSALKYIRLVMNNNKMITMDDVEMFVIKSLPMAFGGEISSKDKVDLVNTIKSYLLKMKGKSAISGSLNFNLKYYVPIEADKLIDFEDDANMILKPPNRMNVDSQIKFTPLASLNNKAPSNRLKINEKKLIDDEIDLLTNKSNAFNIDSEFKFLDLSDFKIITSEIFKINDKIDFDDTFAPHTIKSLGIESENHIAFKDYFVPAPKTYEWLEVNKLIEFKDKNKTITRVPTTFDFNDTIDIKNYTKLKPTYSKPINPNSKFSFLSEAEFEVYYVALCRFTEKLLFEHNVKLSDIKTFMLNVNTLTEFKSKMLLEIGHIITVHIEGEALDEILGSLKFTMLKGENLQTKKNMINFQYNSLVRDDKSDIISSNKYNMIKDFMVLGKYRYALLEDIEDIDMTDYRNSTIDSIILLRN